MFTDKEFWMGVVAGVVMVYAWHWYAAKRSSAK